MATTDAQIAANLANARLSTGPRTPKGKARVALNSLQHGFRSDAVLLPGEDPAELEAVRAAIHEEYFPEGFEQTRCAGEMTASWWRLLRARALQQEVLSRKMLELQAADPTLSGIPLTARAEEQLHRDSKYYLSLIRYEARFDRQYDRARRILLQNRGAEERSATALMNHTMEAIFNAPIPIGGGGENSTSKPNPRPAPPSQTPRNARCPCGSGEKYKRCCGDDAPPVHCN